MPFHRAHNHHSTRATLSTISSPRSVLCGFPSSGGRCSDGTTLAFWWAISNVLLCSFSDTCFGFTLTPPRRACGGGNRCHPLQTHLGRASTNSLRLCVRSVYRCE